MCETKNFATKSHHILLLVIHFSFVVFVNLGLLEIQIGGATQMSQQNTNEDLTTDTAYGDPVIASSPTINNEYKKATSTIPESTQNGNSRGSNTNWADTEKKDPTTFTAYGDPAE